jgi:glycosyltransferase involved in cell wall biosynthesis
LDTTAFLWRVKERVYRRADMHIAAPSKWLVDMARRSPLLKRCQVHHIPYGIDTDTFHPIARQVARVGLGIPVDANVVMIIAIPGGERKGAEYLLAALHKLQPVLRLWILVVGGRGVLNGVPRGFSVREVGYVDSSEFMNLCYSSADVFILPTLADNLPLSLLEALAAGTPSVAFETGGVPDVVRHMETGYLCRYKDSEDLARGIQTLMNASVMASMRSRCRDVATKEYAREVQARRYIEVYERAVNLRREAPGTDASASD